MSSSDSDTKEEQGALILEMRELRQEFQEYVETTTQYQTNRRVENIQVLIALSVIAGTITLYSGGFLDTSIWQNQIQSRYWNIIFTAFIGANAVFLLLKLVTIPLLPVSSSGIVSYLNEEVEPFLYLFAILGVVFSLIVRGLSMPFYGALTINQRGYLALGSLFFPVLIAGGYAQIYRITSVLQRERPILLEISYALDEMTRAGAITAEMQTNLMLKFLTSMTPTPTFLLVLGGLEEVAESVFDLSEETMNLFVEMNNLLIKTLLFTTSPGISAILTHFNQNLEDILVRKQTSEKELTEDEKRKLRELIVNYRNKRSRGELREEDLEEITEFFENQEDNGSDTEE